MKPKNYRLVGAALIVVVMVLSLGCLGSSEEQKTAQGELQAEEQGHEIGKLEGTFGEEKTEKGGIRFYDVRVQAPEFISYYDSITLTPEQDTIKSDVLSSMPASCCKDYSMLDCCCPCIFSKTVWGLSNFLIAEQGYDAEQLEDAVARWVSFTNEDGYAGDACYKGRCNLPFEEDGCGGMDKLVLGAG